MTIALVAATSSGLVTTGAASAAASCPVGITAHRGSTDATHTENTVRAARAAVANGADTLEGDLQTTSNGVWMLMHDATVDRTTNGHGAVSGLSWTQVLGLTTTDGVKGGVPSVAAMLQTMQAHPEVRLQLEIKDSRVSSARMSALLRQFATYKVAPRLLITSFHPAPLAQVRGYSTNWHTALISNQRILAATTKKYGSTAIVNASAITPTYVSQMHGQRLEVFSFVANARSTWDTLVAAKVDGIATDRVPDAQSWCAAG